MRLRLAERVVDKIDSTRLASPGSIVRRNDLLADRSHLPRLFESKKGKLILASTQLRDRMLVGQRKIGQGPKGNGGTGARKQARQKSSPRVFIHFWTPTLCGGR